MSKIRITDKSFEIEGKLEKGRVTPFGTSAHIPFKKEHTGKIVKVIIPTETKYIWLISDAEKNLLFRSAKKNIEKENGLLRHYNLTLIEELKKDEFNIDSLIKILEFVDNKKLVNKIKSIYNVKELD